MNLRPLQADGNKSQEARISGLMRNAPRHRLTQMGIESQVTLSARRAGSRQHQSQTVSFGQSGGHRSLPSGGSAENQFGFERGGFWGPFRDVRQRPQLDTSVAMLSEGE